MSRRHNDKIGTIAAACLIVCVVVSVISGALVAATQAAIDESVSQQEALACARAARMCVAVNESKK